MCTKNEEDLFREIDELVAKLVVGTATPQERDRLTELYEQRSQLLRPAVSSEIEELVRRRA